MLGARPLVLILCSFLGQACTCRGEDASPPKAAKKKAKQVKPKTAPLAEKQAWLPVDAPVDPLAPHRPTEVDCPRGGWRVERQGFEINTMACNYAMFGQPTLIPIEPGDRVFAVLYHFDLMAKEPATAHVALLLGDRVVWEQRIEIPGKANVYNIEWTADFKAPAGTPVFFHLHNHGQNTWTLASVEIARD